MWFQLIELNRIFSHLIVLDYWFLNGIIIELTRFLNGNERETVIRNILKYLFKNASILMLKIICSKILGESVMVHNNCEAYWIAWNCKELKIFLWKCRVILKLIEIRIIWVWLYFVYTVGILWLIISRKFEYFTNTLS